jgi:translation initiation factor 5A
MSSDEDQQQSSDNENVQDYDDANFNDNIDDYSMTQIDTGALDSTTIPVNRLRIGKYALLEGRPCRVVEIAKSKTGKHGHAKANIAGTDLFTGKRYEAHLPTSHDIEVPIVQRLDYSLILIDGKFTQLIDLSGTMREDVEVTDDEICERLVQVYESGEAAEIIVTVLSSLGETKIIEFRKVQ